MTDPDQRLKLGLAHVTYQGAEPTLFHKVLVRLRRASAAGFPVGKKETVFPAWEIGGRFTDLSLVVTVVRDRSPELFSRYRKSSSKGSRSLYLCEPGAVSHKILQALTKRF